MRWLILGAALSAADSAGACRGIHAEFDGGQERQSDEHGAGFHRLQGPERLAGAYLVGRAARTQSFAVTIYDPDARAGGGWWHRMVFNIPETVHALAAGAGSEGSKDLPADASQGRNDFGVSQYCGPCTPVGDHARHYEITVHAVKVARLPLDNIASGAEVSAQLRSNTLATAKFVGRYERRN